jgi:type I restriction enzyme, S subunit
MGTLARIGDTCEVGDGTHSTIARQESGVKYVTSRNLKDGNLDLSKIYFISENDYVRHFSGRGKALTKPEAGDLIFSIIGSLGEPYLVRESDRFGISSSVAIVRPDRNKIESRFLLYWARGPIFQNALQSIRGGVAQGYVSLEMIRSLPVPILDIPSQKCIADTLSKYDELIENNHQRIRVLEEIARKLYREWFVQFRFPGHDKNSRNSATTGEIPQGWKWCNLHEVADVNKAQINARTAPDEIGYIDISSVTSGAIETVTPYRFNDAPSRARRIVHHGDILWSCVRPNRRSHTLVIHPAADTIASTGFAVLTAKKVPYPYLYLATTTDEFVTYLSNSATGAAYPAVSATTFERAAILVPPDSLLEKFGAISIPLSEEISCLQKKNSILRKTRDLLLPRLLSGQIKLEAN